MKVPSKGNTIEIAPGVRFVERNHSRPFPVYFLEALSEPDVREEVLYGELRRQYRWKARNLVTGAETAYVLTDGLLHYGPTLFQNYLDSEQFWTRPLRSLRLEGGSR